MGGDADRVALRFTEEEVFAQVPVGELLAKATVLATATDQSINDATEDLSVFKPGSFVTISGFTSTNNNITAKVVTSAASKLMFPTGTGITDEALGDDVTIKTVLTNLRFTGETLNQETDTVQSQEISADRQVSDIIRTSIRGAGDINGEMSYDAYDDFLVKTLFAADWSEEVVELAADTGIAAVASGNKYTGDAADFDNLVANQWIEVRGFTTAANNGFFKVVSAAIGGTELFVTGGTLVDEGSGDAITITMGAQIVNGTTGKSYTLEKDFTDLTQVLVRYPGMMIDQFSLNVTAENLLTCAFAFMGEKAVAETTSFATGTPIAAPENPVMNAIDNVDGILENNVELGVRSLTFQVTNNLRTRAEVSNLGPISIGAGRVEISGTIEAYFSSLSLKNKYLAFTETSLALKLEDGDGNAYIFDFPAVKLTQDNTNAESTNSDVIENINFATKEDATENITIRIAKFAA